jgi:cytochrome c oxidase cbb3-type subunit 2
MKNAPLFLIGLFAALAVSFGGIVLGSHAQLSSLTPYFDADGGGSYPERTSGIASRGQLVYADLGCAACHTQQVRRPDFGSDQARGWGERQSVARDYIHQIRPQLGVSRLGPDLMNLVARKPADMKMDEFADGLYNLLYNGSPTHPSYKFLFDVRATNGERSSRALKLTGPAAPAAGFEVVPTERAQSLVAHLLSLNTGFDYPEARPVVVPKAEHAAGKHEEKKEEPKK